MNGVQFSDIPFFKETNSPQYQKLAKTTGSEYQLMRLYAMGRMLGYSSINLMNYAKYQDIA